MKTKQALYAGLLIYAATFGMEKSENVHKKFEFYLFSHSETVNFDDTHLTVRIQQSLFNDLVETASENKRFNPAPLAELKAMVKLYDEDHLLLTEKSILHRLLSYIQHDGTSLNTWPTLYPVLIKGTVVNIALGKNFWHPQQVSAVGYDLPTNSN